MTDSVSDSGENSANQALQDVPIFSRLRDADLDHIAALLIPRRVSKNQVILLRGDQVTSLYLIGAGAVKLVATSEDGREVILATRTEGDFFGELSLFDDHPFEATVIATDDVELLVLRREDFHRCLDQWPDIAIGLLRTLCGRLRAAEIRISALALLDVPQRVAHVLIGLADENDGTVITQPVTHRFLAQLVGTSRESVSRIMGQLSSQEIINVGKESAAVPDRRHAGESGTAASVDVKRRVIRIVDRRRLELAAGRV
ncbi:MAG: Crp/Fnr family transcriptional regulator [Gemmatimonadota bacterium]|nr:Crp/Fnr family transcriptional regulator [Gemmatimonadota bacterium]